MTQDPPTPLPDGRPAQWAARPGEFPPRPSPERAAEFRRRKRGTNYALLIVLLGLAALFFAITLSKMAVH